MHRIRSSLRRLLLAVFTAILLIFVLNALLPSLSAKLTTKQQLVSQVLSARLDDRLAANSDPKAESSPIQQQKQQELYKKEIVQEISFKLETTKRTPDTNESNAVLYMKQQRKPLNMKDGSKNTVSEGYVLQDRAMAPSHQSVADVDRNQQLSLRNNSTARHKLMERNRRRMNQLREQRWKALRHRRMQTLPRNFSRSISHLQNWSAPFIGKLRTEDVRSVEAFVFFVGWQRSGHSIIGSLLDGHPDVVIAHELFLFSNLPQFIYMDDAKSLLYKALYHNSIRASKNGARSEYDNEKGYNLHLQNSWQGRFRKLRVIGDKTAGDVTNTFIRDPTLFDYLLMKLRGIVGVPLKVINVVRNPFDMVATLTLYRSSTKWNIKVNATENNKYNNTDVLEWATSIILRKAKAIHEIEEMNYNWNFIRLYSEDFIRDPKRTMAALCTFLGIECTEEYLQQCVDKTFSSVSKSRRLIVWNPSTLAEINRAIQTIPFLRRYSFDGT